MTEVGTLTVQTVPDVRVTSVNDVRDALVAVLGEALPENFALFDGPVGPADLPEEFAAVGTSAEDFDAANARQTPVPGLTTHREERWSVTCGIRVTSGDSGPTAARTRRLRVGELLQLIGLALRADEQLGGACHRAVLGDEFRWVEFANDKGGVCDLTFTVAGLTRL